MKLLINNEEIQFEISDEKTASEVVDSVSDWAAKRDLIFSSAMVDGKDYNIDEVPDLNIDDIEEINCFIQSKAELIIASLTEGAAYCERINNYIEDSLMNEKFEAQELEELLKGVEWIKEMTISVLQIVGLNPVEVKHYDKTIESYFEDLTSFSAQISSMKNEKDILSLLNEKKQMFQEFKGIYKVVLMSDKLKTLITKSLDSPNSLVKTLKEIKDKHSEQMINLEKIAELYQSGKDSDAVEKMHIFLDYIYIYTRTCYQIAPVFNVDLKSIVIDDVTLEEINEEINAFLAEIIEVMENNDIISLADILEYEIKPLMQNTSLYMDKLLEKIINQ